MAIDPTKEQLKTFGQGAKMFPRRRGDRPVHPTTLWRWNRVGVLHAGRRVHLEAIKTPSGMATTTEAIQRFLDKLNSIESTAAPILQRKAVDAAVAQLNEDGV